MATVPRFKDVDKAVLPKGGKPTIGFTPTMRTVKWSPNDEGGKVVNRNLMAMRSVEQQNSLAPTDSEPVRMHHKLAGGC
jgi:hypothetical protein